MSCILSSLISLKQAAFPTLLPPTFLLETGIGGIVLPASVPRRSVQGAGPGRVMQHEAAPIIMLGVHGDVAHPFLGWLCSRQAGEFPLGAPDPG